MKYALCLLICFSAFILSAQNNLITEINYQEYSNGKVVDGSNTSIIYCNSILYLNKNDDIIRQFIDYNLHKNINIIEYNGLLYKTETPFESLPKPTLSENTEEILGYKCNYATFSSFSNKIEVWFTDKANAKGSPYKNFIPNVNSLVLKIVINGNETLIATSIKEIKNQDPPEYPLTEALEISNPEFEEIKIKSRYTKINVFNKEIINFNPEIPSPIISDTSRNETYHFSNGTVILKKIGLPEIVTAGAYIYAKITSWSNGDAYDRTGSVFIIPANTTIVTMLSAFKNGLIELPIYTDNIGQNYQGIFRTKNYEPPIEILRFFTSFGTRYFNELRIINNYTWEDSVVYNQDVTSLIPNNSKEIWIGVFIGNYDKGGHTVSLDLNFYPTFEEKVESTKFILPIFNTVNILEMSGQNYGRLFNNDTLRVDFDITENLISPKLLYTTTGHGGWENGDEFIPKLNQIFLDGKQIFSIVPWRTDCGTYRLSNPASGNFENGLSSSDFSRSNWCPGTLTPPYLIPLNILEKGPHTIEVIIDGGQDEGGSFSHWNVSGVIVGDVKTEK
jgi:hypothetical protein